MSTLFGTVGEGFKEKKSQKKLFQDLIKTEMRLNMGKRTIQIGETLVMIK